MNTIPASPSHRIRHAFILAIAIAILTSLVVAHAGVRETTAVMDLAQTGNTRELMRLIKENPDLLDAQDSWGWTPLMHAAGFHQTATVQALLDAGANIEIRDRKSNFTAADCVRGALGMCTPEWLKTQEDFLHQQNLPEYQRTAQMNKIRATHTFQARKEMQETLDLLTAGRKKPTATSSAPAPAPASQPDRACMVALLKTGNTPELLRLIKENPALLDTQDSWGWTPLMYACAYNHTATARALLAAGANIHLHDNDGYSAVDVVRSNLQTCTPEYLAGQREYLHDLKFPDADITAQMEKLTPLHSADARKEWQEILDLLTNAKKTQASTSPAAASQPARYTFPPPFTRPGS